MNRQYICLNYLQLDALQLDHDIIRIVRDQLISAAQNISVNNYLSLNLLFNHKMINIFFKTFTS